MAYRIEILYRLKNKYNNNKSRVKSGPNKALMVNVKQESSGPPSLFPDIFLLCVAPVHDPIAEALPSITRLMAQYWRSKSNRISLPSEIKLQD